MVNSVIVSELLWSEFNKTANMCKLKYIKQLEMFGMVN